MTLGQGCQVFPDALDVAPIVQSVVNVGLVAQDFLQDSKGFGLVGNGSHQEVQGFVVKEQGFEQGLADLSVTTFLVQGQGGVVDEDRREEAVLSEGDCCVVVVVALFRGNDKDKGLTVKGRGRRRGCRIIICGDGGCFVILPQRNRSRGNGRDGLRSVRRQGSSGGALTAVVQLLQGRPETPQSFARLSELEKVGSFPVGLGSFVQ